MKFNFEDRDKNTSLRVACFAFKFHQIKSKFKRDKAVFTASLQLANIPEDEYKIWQKHQNTPLDTAKILLKNSHKEVIKAVDKFSDEELLLKANLPILLTLRLEVTVYQPPLRTMIGR